MNLGVRAHDFGKLPLEELAAKISGKSFLSIQLALAKALPDINSSLGSLSPGMGHYLRKAFADKGLQIAILGCYINPINPNLEERRKALERFKEHLRFVRDFGCTIVGTETGSLNPDMSFNVENHGEEAFKILIESMSEMVAEAEKFGVLVGVEGVRKLTLNTPQKVKRLLDTIRSNNLQVILDPVNFIEADNYESQNEIISESFGLFGDRIVAVHVKDFIIEDGIKKVVPPGKGLLNYELFFKLLKSRKPYINIILEDIRLDAIEEACLFLRELYDRS